MVNFKDTASSNRKLINTKAISRMGNITVRESTLGAQATPMKDPMKMGRSMATEYILISMDRYIKENGLEENATAKECKYRHKEESKKSLFKWAKE